MDSLQRHWYGQAFELAYATKRGNEFQDWFVQIAGLVYGADFDAIRNYGPLGDFKCDGRRLSTGTIYQCYAPGEIKESETTAKIAEDFPGAIRHWPNFIKTWCFVYNDARGVPPTVAQYLDAIQQQYPAVAIIRWGKAPLRDLVFSLDADRLVHLFGYAPTLAMLSHVGFAELKPVLEAIAQKQPDPLDEPTKPPSPSKIEKNNLSTAASGLLQIGRLKEPVVEDFLSLSGWPETANRIAKAIRDHLVVIGMTSEEIFGR